MSRKRPQQRPAQALAAATPAGLAVRTLPWTMIATVFLVALAIRLIHIWQIRQTPFFDVLMGDAKAYDEWAMRIAGGDWVGKDVFYQAPLYPYFLGTLYTIAGRSLMLIRVCQALVGSVSCLLLALAAHRLFSLRAGWIAGIAMGLYAPAIFLGGLLQKSVLDEFFICLILWLAATLIARPWHSRSWLWLGLATGALSLTRENALVFVVVLGAWALVAGSRTEPVGAGTATLSRRHDAGAAARSGHRRFAWQYAALFGVGLAIVLLPVVVRNNVVSGGFYLTTSQFGPNFFMGNNARADGTAMSLRTGRGTPEYERQDAIDIAEQARGRKLTPAEVSSYWTEQSMAFIKAQPVAWLKLQLRKSLLLWNATEILDTESQESYAEWSTPLRLGGIVGHFGILVPLALFGILLTWSERGRLWPLLAMLVAYAASVVIFYIYARYRYPLVPILLLYAAAGLDRLPAFVRGFREAPSAIVPADNTTHVPAVAGTFRTSPSRRLAVVIAVVAAAVVTNWSIVSADMNRTVTEHNMGAALQSEGRLDEALASYRRAIAISPDYAPAYANIGTVLQKQGKLNEAIASYQRALALRPSFPEVEYNLANALLAQNKPVEAAEHFKRAAAGIPGAADVHNNLGGALAAQNKWPEAVAEFEKAVQFDPMSATAHRNLGNALASAGRPREGLEHLLKATQLDPKDASAHYDFGSLLLEGNLLPEAINELRTAITLTPDSYEAHNNLGIALGASGRIDESIAEFREALRLNPDFEDAKRNLEMTLAAERKTQK